MPNISCCDRPTQFKSKIQYTWKYFYSFWELNNQTRLSFCSSLWVWLNNVLWCLLRYYDMHTMQVLSCPFLCHFIGMQYNLWSILDKCNLIKIFLRFPTPWKLSSYLVEKNCWSSTFKRLYYMSIQWAACDYTKSLIEVVREVNKLCIWSGNEWMVRATGRRLEGDWPADGGE